MSFWFWLIGFYFTFMPMYVLGLMGVTRRLNHFDDPSLQIWFIISTFGAMLIALGIGSFLVQLVVSFMRREQLRDVTGDPWHGRTLEWSTSSPPPAYNFAFTPVIHDLDAWWDMKRRGHNVPEGGYRPIHMPKNTGTGVYLVRAQHRARLRPDLVYLVARRRLGRSDCWWSRSTHTFNYKRDYYIPAEEVMSSENRRAQALAAE